MKYIILFQDCKVSNNIIIIYYNKNISKLYNSRLIFGRFINFHTYVMFYKYSLILNEVCLYN